MERKTQALILILPNECITTVMRRYEAIVRPLVKQIYKQK